MLKTVTVLPTAEYIREPRATTPAANAVVAKKRKDPCGACAKAPLNSSLGLEEVDVEDGVDSDCVVCGGLEVGVEDEAVLVDVVAVLEVAVLLVLLVERPVLLGQLDERDLLVCILGLLAWANGFLSEPPSLFGWKGLQVFS